MPTIEEYVPTLEAYTRALLDDEAIGATCAAMNEWADGIRRLGTMLAPRADRAADNIGRIESGAQRVRESLEALTSAGDDDKAWNAENVLVNLANLHIAVDSNIARSEFATTAKWVIESLAQSGSAQLMTQITDELSAVMTAEWTMAASAQAASQVIQTIYAIERPEDVRTHDLDASELPAMYGAIQEVYGLFGSVVPGEHGDGSVRSAEWLGLALEGGAPVQPQAPSQSSPQGGAPSEAPAQQSAPPPFDLEAVDMTAVNDVNQATCKDASSSETLEYVAADWVVLIGRDHPSALLEGVGGHARAYRGTVQVKSARIGAGTMVVTGAPPAQQSNVQWAIQQFSRKDVQFR